MTCGSPCVSRFPGVPRKSKTNLPGGYQILPGMSWHRHVGGGGGGGGFTGPAAAADVDGVTANITNENRRLSIGIHLLGF